MRRLLLLAVVLLLGVTATLGHASAASLAVTSRTLQAMHVTHPCPGTATAVPATRSGNQYTAVTVTVPDACAGRPVNVAVVNGSTARTGTAVAASPTATRYTVPLSGGYTVGAATTVRATVSGWGLPVSMLPAVSCRIPGNPAATCTATATDAANWWEWLNPDRHDITVRVTTSTPTAEPWELTFNFAAPGFRAVSDLGGPTTLTSQTGCADLPVYRVTGSGATASAPQTFTLIANSWIGGNQNLLSCS